MKFANTKFTHFDRTFEPGDEVPDDDEMVRLRPDLFSNKPPAKRPASKKAATPNKETS